MLFQVAPVPPALELGVGLIGRLEPPGTRKSKPEEVDRPRAPYELWP
jgi:hypothetical protein